MARPALPKPPRLLLACGRDDGVAFPLHGAEGGGGSGPGERGPARRHPYASTESAEIVRAAGGFVVRDALSRNGTWVNWERLGPTASAPLPPGALLGVGRSLPVLQP